MRAREHLSVGQASASSDLLSRAAERWLAAGSREEAARCHRLAAAVTLHTSNHGYGYGGGLSRAADLARAAIAESPSGSLERARSYATLAQVAMARGETDAAWAALSAALTSLTSGPQSLHLLSDHTGSQQVGAADDGADAVLMLSDAAAAFEAGQLGTAARHAAAARQQALHARSAPGYISAVAACAALSEAGGDRPGAYGALAVGWATLGDLIGRDAAAAVFAPMLGSARRRWGEAVYEQAKAGAEASWRAANRAEQSGGWQAAR